MKVNISHVLIYKISNFYWARFAMKQESDKKLHIYYRPLEGGSNIITFTGLVGLGF